MKKTIILSIALISLQGCDNSSKANEVEANTNTISQTKTCGDKFDVLDKFSELKPIWDSVLTMKDPVKGDQIYQKLKKNHQDLQKQYVAVYSKKDNANYAELCQLVDEFIQTIKSEKNRNS